MRFDVDTSRVQATAESGTLWINIYPDDMNVPPDWIRSRMTLPQFRGLIWWLEPQTSMAIGGNRQLGCHGVFAWYRSGHGYASHIWNVVLWPIPLLLCTPAVLLLRSGILARQRANTNACRKCGYSLAGLAHGTVCPECGKGEGTT